MTNGIDSREVKCYQQIEENENRIKERERKANDITFKELCDKCEEYSKIIIQARRGVLQEYIIMGNCYF
ncbi:putative integrase [Orientia tsutsugamushi str. UT76]|nr:putative integrase [Orientia tsutsugamushi str. UT76]